MSLFNLAIFLDIVISDSAKEAGMGPKTPKIERQHGVIEVVCAWHSH